VGAKMTGWSTIGGSKKDHPCLFKNNFILVHKINEYEIPLTNKKNFE
jgi:hypothetical protein